MKMNRKKIEGIFDKGESSFIGNRRKHVAIAIPKQIVAARLSQPPSTSSMRYGFRVMKLPRILFSFAKRAWVVLRERNDLAGYATARHLVRIELTSSSTILALLFTIAPCRPSNHAGTRNFGGREQRARLLLPRVSRWYAVLCECKTNIKCAILRVFF